MQKIGWTAGALGLYMVVSMAARQPGFSGPYQSMAWVYVLGYGLFGVLLLGAVARWWRQGSTLWRPVMLCLGGLAAAFEIWLDPKPHLAVTFWDRWMLAMFGLMTVALAARFIPSRLIALWLGIDRRLPQA